MYKRKARVIFLDASGGGAAPAASAVATELGGDWLEARAAALEPDAHASAPLLSDELKQWADLIVYFDQTHADRMRPLPPTAHTKHWPLDIDADTAGEALDTDLRRRVEGMIGGMRMLSRSSSREDD